MSKQTFERRKHSTKFAFPWGFANSVRWLIISADEAHWSNSFGAWLALNAIDTFVTWLCLSKGMLEANLFPKLAMVTYGRDFMMAAKMGLALLIGILVWKRSPSVFRGILNLGMAIILIVNCIFVGEQLWFLNLAK